MQAQSLLFPVWFILRLLFCSGPWLRPFYHSNPVLQSPLQVVDTPRPKRFLSERLMSFLVVLPPPIHVALNHAPTTVSLSSKQDPGYMPGGNDDNNKASSANAAAGWVPWSLSDEREKPRVFAFEFEATICDTMF